MDVDQMCAEVRAWDLDFHPLTGPHGENGVGKIIQTQCGSVQIGSARFIASIEQWGAPPPGHLTFVIPETRLRRLWWRGHDVDSGTVLVFPIGSELHSISGPDFEIHTITASEQDVRSICENFQLTLPATRRRPEVFRLPPVILENCRTSLQSIRDDLHLRSAAYAWRVLELLVRFWVQSENSRIRDHESLRVRDRAVKLCMESMADEDWQYLSASELCRLTGVSERTLQYAFRERFNLTPAAFIKARRLAGVRRALLKPNDNNLKIADAMAEFEFWHVGQFAADYRAAFGEIPSVTLKRAIGNDNSPDYEIGDRLVG